MKNCVGLCNCLENCEFLFRKSVAKYYVHPSSFLSGKTLLNFDLDFAYLWRFNCTLPDLYQSLEGMLRDLFNPRILGNCLS